MPIQGLADLKASEDMSHPPNVLAVVNYFHDIFISIISGRVSKRFVVRRTFRTPQPETCGERRTVEKGPYMAGHSLIVQVQSIDLFNNELVLLYE